MSKKNMKTANSSNFSDCFLSVSDKKNFYRTALICTLSSLFAVTAYANIPQQPINWSKVGSGVSNFLGNQNTKNAIGALINAGTAAGTYAVSAAATNAAGQHAVGTQQLVTLPNGTIVSMPTSSPSTSLAVPTVNGAAVVAMPSTSQTITLANGQTLPVPSTSTTAIQPAATINPLANLGSALTNAFNTSATTYSTLTADNINNITNSILPQYSVISGTLPSGQVVSGISIGSTFCPLSMTQTAQGTIYFVTYNNNTIYGQISNGIFIVQSSNGATSSTTTPFIAPSVAPSPTITTTPSVASTVVTAAPTVSLPASTSIVTTPSSTAMFH